MPNKYNLEFSISLADLEKFDAELGDLKTKLIEVAWAMLGVPASCFQQKLGPSFERSFVVPTIKRPIQEELRNATAILTPENLQAELRLLIAHECSWQMRHDGFLVECPVCRRTKTLRELHCEARWKQYGVVTTVS